jgi:hypothetical protein
LRFCVYNSTLREGILLLTKSDFCVFVCVCVCFQMQSVTLPLFCSLVITPPTHALEGTLLVITFFFQFNYFNNPFTILIIHCCFSHGCIHHE